MTECMNSEIRDALPDLLGGRLSELDMATMTAHVESCAACRTEIELLHEVRRSAPFAPAIDVARVVAALPAYGAATITAPPRGDRPMPTVSSRPVVWKAAAVAVLITLGGLGIADLSRDGVSRNSARTTADANVQAPAIATTTPLNRAPIGLSLVAGVQDLTDTQIETLLAELDGLEAVPSAEPEPFTISVEELEGGL